MAPEQASLFYVKLQRMYKILVLFPDMEDGIRVVRDAMRGIGITNGYRPHLMNKNAYRGFYHKGYRPICIEPTGFQTNYTFYAVSVY